MCAPHIDMKRIYALYIKGVLLVAALLFAAGANAETVTQKQALGIAEKFFNAARGLKMAPPKMVYNGRRLTTNHLFSPFYVFNHPTGGFVVIAAENKAFPILSYNFKENFDPNNMDEGTKMLLTLYALHIERIRYDSRVPEEAIKAWENISGDIYSVISAQYDVTDVIEPWERVADDVENVWGRGDADLLVSEIYSPRQWSEMLNEQLLREKNVSIGLLLGATPLPGVVHGRKGEFYRIYFGKSTDTLYRLLPTEFMSEGEVALLENPSYQYPKEMEEPPFSFYNSFIEEQRNAAARERAAIEETLIPTSPVVEWIGGGRYSITLPENVVMARVYNAAGALFNEQYFRDTNVANLNITVAPTGFYFALLITESGKPYSVKFFR